MTNKAKELPENNNYKANRVTRILRGEIFPRIPKFYTEIAPGYKEMFEKCDRLGYEAFTPEMEKFVIPANLLISKHLHPDEYLKLASPNKKVDILICAYEKPSYWSLDENDILNNTNKASNCLPESERREYELRKIDFLKNREQLEKCNLLLKQTPDDEKLLKTKKSMTQYSNDFATRFLKYGYKDIISDPGLVESYIKNRKRFHYKILTVEWKNTNKWIEFYKRQIEASKGNVKLYEPKSSLRNFKHKFEAWFTEHGYEIPVIKEKILPKTPILEDKTKAFEDRKTLKPDQTSETAKVEAHTEPETGAVNTWKDIVIEIIDNETLSIKTGKNKASRLHCSKIGFMNKKTSLPNLQWRMLESLAKYKGLIPYKEWEFRARKHIEKQVSELRKTLKSYFKIDSDPIPFKKKIGYQTAFTLRDKRPGADTQ